MTLVIITITIKVLCGMNINTGLSATKDQHMGHESIATTMEIYTHVLNKERIAAANIINDAFKKQAGE